MTNHVHTPFLAGVLCFVASGCGVPDANPDLVERRDSAGVEIVEARRPAPNWMRCWGSGGTSWMSSIHRCSVWTGGVSERPLRTGRSRR